MASLLASMLAFGRLGVDSEVTALRAAGIGSLRMLRPTFIVFLGITDLHLLLAEGLAPRANQIAMDATKTAVASVSTVRDSGKSNTRTPSATFGRPVIFPVFRNDRLEHLIYAQGFDGLNSLLTITFVLNGGNVNPDGVTVFIEGFQDQGSTSGNPQSKLNTDISELARTPLDHARLGVTKSFEDMTLFEAWSLLGLMKGSRNAKESRKLQVGLALTIVIVFGYYIVSVFGSLIGQLGYISPILGALLPNLAGDLLALAFLFSAP